jgi:hypothetical protein
VIGSSGLILTFFILENRAATLNYRYTFRSSLSPHRASLGFSRYPTYRQSELYVRDLRQSLTSSASSSCGT